MLCVHMALMFAVLCFYLALPFIHSLHSVPNIFVKDHLQNSISKQNGYIDVKAGTTIYLHCQSEEPIKWSYPDVDEMSGDNLFRTKDDYVCTFSKGKISNCSLTLELTATKAENTGEYRCFNQNQLQNFESVYIFVNDINNIFIHFDKLEDIFIAAVQGQPLTIPCKTSFSYANVSLWTTDFKPKRLDIVHKMNYSPVKGFYSPHALFGFLDKLQCRVRVANNFDVIDVHLVWTTSSSVEITPVIQDNHPRNVSLHSKLHLVCSAIVEKGMAISIDWIHPQGYQVDEHRILQKYRTRDLKGLYFEVYQDLTIVNTTLSDTGNYSCKVSDLRGKIWRTEISVTVVDAPKVVQETFININLTNDSPLLYYAHPGDIVKLVVEIKSEINISFINLFWYKDDHKIANGRNQKLKKLTTYLSGTKAVLVMTDFSKLDAGIYSLNASFYKASTSIAFTVHNIDQGISNKLSLNILLLCLGLIIFGSCVLIFWAIFRLKIFSRSSNQASYSIKIFQYLPSPKYVLWKRSSKSTLYKSSAKKIKFEKKLGEGEYGIVYLAQIHGLNDKKERKIVAIKKLKENATEVERKILLHEIELLSSIGQHENVLSLLGVIDEGSTLMMIVEYCAKGGLQKYLKENKNNFEDQLNQDSDEIDKSIISKQTSSLTTLKLIEFTRQIACGMEYLESKGYVHRDLAARNIFINENDILKIGDFGLAKSSNYIMQSNTPLPYKWMAVESLRSGIFTNKSDVWSFGVLIWEIFTLGDEPYSNINGLSRLKNFLDFNRLNRPYYCPAFLADLMMKCWQVEPHLRPTFADIHKDITINLYVIKYWKNDLVDFKNSPYCL